MERPNPCLSCGACCAYFRASFYWAETDSAPGGTVPAEMTEKLNDFRCVMKGMRSSPVRCVALEGQIGERVFCRIHALRSSVCREFDASWVNGEKNIRCDRARAAHNLAPLPPDAWGPRPPDKERGPGG